MPELETTVDTSAMILIVDDSPENRYVVRRALTRAGMEVIEAGTGAEGSRIGAETIPDLIVLDVNLPDTTGFELCRHFKSDPLTAHVPVIHLSQSAIDDGSRVRGLEGGADAYLTDPIHGSVLVATVRALLRMRRAEEELRRQAEDADRIAGLASELAAARTESEVILALMDALTDPFAVHRAHLFPARPWMTRPQLVYPIDTEPPGGPLPLTPEQVDAYITEVLEDRTYEHRLVYDDSGERPWLVMPLIAYGQEMGTLIIEFEAGIELPPRNQARLGAAAERTAQAMERAQMFELQRAIASTLQASLLPAELPEIPGVQLGAEYRAGAEQMVVGGDFYDVLQGVDGWNAVIGDVCGRGAAAASRTSLARHTAREAARHVGDPAVVLSELERAIDEDKRSDSLDLITAITLSFKPSSAGVDLSYAIAGHPLPLLIRADGSVEPVGRPGPILGIVPNGTYERLELTLAPGETLFLYTDGVIESRRGGVLFGEERLMQLLSEMVLGGATVQELATEPIHAASSYNELHDDDMATLVIRASAQG